MNHRTILQDFEWYLPSDASFWKTVVEQAKDLHRLGFTDVWLPPAYKGQAGVNDVGYGVYDLYDLGEFEQKGTIPTKYGTAKEYQAAISALHAQDINVIADIVLNHMMGADKSETVEATNINEQNRNEDTSGPHQATVWTRFEFPGREGKYSRRTWDASDFTGTDYDANTGSHAIMSFEGKEWNDNVSHENGNFDYIMGDDVDFSNPEVVEALTKWGAWYVKKTGIDGFRLDAVKSIDSHFYGPWLAKMQEIIKQRKERPHNEVFSVGEYWSGNVDDLLGYLDQCENCMNLFDVPLHFKLRDASLQPQNYDMHQLFDRTLTACTPERSVPFVDNHDSQPGQSLESWIADAFKLRAYATILLRNLAYPVVFYGDLWGIEHDNKAPVMYLRELVWIRSHLLGDELIDMNDDDHQKMCWLVRGAHPVFVIWTGGTWKQKDIVEPTLARKTFVDVCDPSHTVEVADDGAASFTCSDNWIGVYILQDDYAQMQAALSEPLA